jgi:hypothetical protein
MDRGRKETNVPDAPGLTWESRHDKNCEVHWPKVRSGHAAEFDSKRNESGPMVVIAPMIHIQQAKTLTVDLVSIHSGESTLQSIQRLSFIGRPLVSRHC